MIYFDKGLSLTRKGLTGDLFTNPAFYIFQNIWIKLFLFDIDFKTGPVKDWKDQFNIRLQKHTFEKENVGWEDLFFQIYFYCLLKIFNFLNFNINDLPCELKYVSFLFLSSEPFYTSSALP